MLSYQVKSFETCLVRTSNHNILKSDFSYFLAFLLYVGLYVGLSYYLITWVEYCYIYHNKPHNVLPLDIIGNFYQLILTYCPY